MPRDVDTVALHATFDLVLRALAQPKASDAPGARAGEAPPSVPAPPDALIAAYQRAKSAARDMATRDPLDALASVIGVGSVLFYLAEKGKNEKCKSMWDAIKFVSSSLSVGYDDAYSKTPTGKAITAFVMAVGPSLAARALDPPRIEAEREAAEATALQRAVISRLDSILDALKTGSAPAARV